jgi:hypothetical protein
MLKRDIFYKTRFLLSFWLAFLICSIVNAEILVGYRLIRTSPEEFMKAHLMPYHLIASKIKNSDQDSRLTRYIIMKNKVVRQDSVTYEFKPDVPGLENILSDWQKVIINVKTVAKKMNEYELKAEINIPSQPLLHSKIDLLKHEQGTLMKFTVLEGSYSKTTLNILISFIRRFKFARESADQAVFDTLELQK